MGTRRASILTASSSSYLACQPIRLSENHQALARKLYTTPMIRGQANQVRNNNSPRSHQNQYCNLRYVPNSRICSLLFRFDLVWNDLILAFSSFAACHDIREPLCLRVCIHCHWSSRLCLRAREMLSAKNQRTRRCIWSQAHMRVVQLTTAWLRSPSSSADMEDPELHGMLSSSLLGDGHRIFRF